MMSDPFTGGTRMPSPRIGWRPVVSLVVSLLLPFATLAQAGREMPVTTSSKEARAFFEQGREHAANSEPALATPLFDKAIQADDRFALAHAYRATSGGGFEVARTFVDRAVALAGGVSPGEKLWIEASRAAVYGDTAALQGAIEALVKLHPDDKWVQLRAGTHYQDMGDWARAGPHYDKATALDPNFAAAFNVIGYTRMATGDLPGAEKALRRYVELRPKAPNAHDSLAELLMKMGRFDDSIASYRKALEVDPGFSSSWEGIGNCQALRGRYPEAREAYARGAAAASDLWGKLRARYWRTVSYVHEGKTGEALASFDETRVFADENGAPGAAIWSRLDAAWLLIETDAVGAAAALLDAAAAQVASPALPPTTRPNFEVALQRLRVLALARIHEFDAARALAQKNRAAAEASRNVAAQKWIAGVQAWTELEAGKPEAALELTARAMRDNAWTLYVEAVAKERKGEVASARKTYGELARWNQNDLGYALVRAKALSRAGAVQ
jgi:tetratricopeptide (TPR) repeat protein